MAFQKLDLPAPFANRPVQAIRPKRHWPILALSAMLVVYKLHSYIGGSPPSFPGTIEHVHHGQDVDWDAHCPQLPAYEHQTPPPPGLVTPSQDELANFLSGAIQVDTSVQDEMPHVKDNPQIWAKIFDPFLSYIKSTWPALHAPTSPISLELVNGHGLLYEWPGSDSELKPLLLMAHQDVVPVLQETRKAWVHDPFGGYYNQTSGLIWGRGTQDTKSTLISILTSVQSLLDVGYKPKRTILLAFGFDEERGGFEGAGSLGQVITDRYGPNGVSMVVDEGGFFAVPEPDSDASYGIAPATAEKGKLNIKATVQTQGGHSSVPPEHTAIGYLSKLIVALETSPEPAVLNTSRSNPAWGRLVCDVARGDIQGPLRHTLTQVVRLEQQQKHTQCPMHSSNLARQLAKTKAKALSQMSLQQRAGFQTTQAIDLVQGGVKVNALPEEVEVITNYRIDSGSSSAALRGHVAKVLRPVAKEYGFNLRAWDEKELSYEPEGTATGTIILSDAFESALEPAPVTPLTGPGSKPWELLSGVIRSVWDPATDAGLDGKDGKKLYISGSLSLGNTDTRWVQQSSRAIFRFSPRSLQPLTEEQRALVGRWGAHTVNENLHASALSKAWEFYTQLIRASDEADI